MSTMTRIILAFFLVCTTISVFGQNKKAYDLFQKGFYDEVVKFYDAKHLEKEDAILLTKSLLRLGKNERALEISGMLYNENPEDEDAFGNFYQALTYDSRYGEAYDLVESKQTSYSEAFRDSMYKDIEKLMIWQYEVRDIEITPEKSINTSDSEYSPLIHNNRIYYCILNTNEMMSDERYDIRASKVSKEDVTDEEKNSSFSLSGLKSSKQNNLGPFCIYENSIYYTVSDDGFKLFFASDMPGGYGMMDIYVSYSTGTGWGTPINLGPWVNTPGNEVFPFHQDDKIYFSSDGLDTYGGLDIFSVDDDDNLENVVNLNKPINSPFDDFGINLIHADKGYFSSDRPGGSGLDDIYSFQLRVEDEEPKITGIMEQRGLAIANQEVFLVDNDGNILEITTTDENGAFTFNRQPDPGKYGIQLAQEPEDSSNISLSITDEAGNVKDKLAMNSKGVFVFEMFALDEVDELSKFADYDTNPYMIELIGEVYKNKPGDLQGKYNIEIMDEDYNELDYVQTDAEGAFEADNLPYGQRFIMQIESSDPNLKMVIMDKDRNVIQELYSAGNNMFAYQHVGDPEDLIALVGSNNTTDIVMKNEAIKIPNIYYAYDSSKLNGRAKRSLDALVETLKNNREIYIELLSHTDSRGTAKSNQILSQQRAKSARNYLIKKGIKAKRITAKGYGWNKLLINCENNSCSEEDHAKNRRTEFQIVSN